MKRKFHYSIILGLLGIIATPLLSSAATFTWIGDGSDTKFNTAGNWSGTNPPPKNEDTARFNLTTSAPYTVTINQAITVDKLEVQNATKVALEIANSSSSTDPDIQTQSIALSHGTLQISGGKTDVKTALWIGSSSGQGNLTLTNGAQLTYSAPSSNANFRLGASGDSKNNTLRVEQGASLTSNASIYLGQGASNSGNTITIHGENSSAYNSKTLNIGSNLANISNNKVEVLDGGKWTNKEQVRIGNNSGATHNRVTVKGAGSQFNVESGTLVQIGHSGGTATNNTVTLSDGAAFSSDSGVTVHRGEGNSFTVSTGASAVINSTLDVGEKVTVEKASLTTRTLDLKSSGRVEVSDSIINVNLKLSAQGESRFIFDLSAGTTSRIDVTGTGANFLITGTSPVFIDLINIDQEGVYDLFTFSSSTNVSEETLVIGTADGTFSQRIIFSSNNISVEIYAIPEPTLAGLAIPGLLLLGLARRLQRR